jgi:hypothetical protein
VITHRLGRRRPGAKIAGHEITAEVAVGPQRRSAKAARGQGAEGGRRKVEGGRWKKEGGRRGFPRRGFFGIPSSRACDDTRITRKLPSLARHLALGRRDRGGEREAKMEGNERART